MFSPVLYPFHHLISIPPAVPSLPSPLPPLLPSPLFFYLLYPSLFPLSCPLPSSSTYSPLSGLSFLSAAVWVSESRRHPAALERQLGFIPVCQVAERERTLTFIPAASLLAKPNSHMETDSSTLPWGCLAHHSLLTASQNQVQHRRTHTHTRVCELICPLFSPVLIGLMPVHLKMDSIKFRPFITYSLYVIQTGMPIGICSSRNQKSQMLFPYTQTAGQS